MKTDSARIEGGSPPEFKYEFKLVAGPAVFTVQGSIQVTCSEEVEIFFPSQLTESLLTYSGNTGLQEIQINSFTTNDVNCPILKYWVTTLITGVSQPKCASPDPSQGCLSITLDTATVGRYPITISAEASGGAKVQSSEIILNVINSYAVSTELNVCTHLEYYTSDE